MKLVDFGFAKIKGNQPLQTPCFTLSYAAPELLQNATGETMSGYDESVDIWSLGVILVSCLFLSVRMFLSNFESTSRVFKILC